MDMNYLDLLKEKRYKDAFLVANKEYIKDPTSPNLRNRASTFLCLKQYSEALADYTYVLNNEDHSSDGNNIFVGMCLWILGEFDKAINVWLDGRKTQYTDAASGVELPAILLFGATHLKDKKLEKEAIRLLKRRWKSKAVINWPGALSGYLLNEIKEEDVINSVQQNLLAHPILTERHLCQLNFYIGLNRLRNNDLNGYVEYLEMCSNSKMGYLEQEYYLAISELDKLNACG